jgi:hypothetical protein
VAFRVVDLFQVCVVRNLLDAFLKRDNLVVAGVAARPDAGVVEWLYEGEAGAPEDLGIARSHSGATSETPVRYPYSQA